MKRIVLLAGVIIAAQMLHAAYRPDRFIEATPWSVQNIGIVIDVPCCKIQDVREAVGRVSEHGRGVVKLSPGTYNIDAPVIIPAKGKNITIDGNGAVLMANSDGPVLKMGE